MTAPIVVFTNSTAGIGNTWLVYHLAWMFHDLGLRVLAADLDPQSNLTASFVNEDRMAGFWSPERPPSTIFDGVDPFLRRVPDPELPAPQNVLEGLEGEVPPFSDEGLAILPGDLALAHLEDWHAPIWPKNLREPERASRLSDAFSSVLGALGKVHGSHLILVDASPGLGLVSQATLRAADHVVFTMSTGLASHQGLHHLGLALNRWNQTGFSTSKQLVLGGYVVLKKPIWLRRPVGGPHAAMSKISKEYRESVLGERSETETLPADDPCCLGVIDHYSSLVTLAEEARKPIFHLKPADASGSHLLGSRDAQAEFQKLAESIAGQIGFPLPTSP